MLKKIDKMKGETIRQRLSELGTSQKELARLLDVTPQAVSAILSASDVRTGTIERICDVLHLRVSFLYGETDEYVSDRIGQLKAKRVEKIWQTNHIGDKVRLLLREQKKKLVSLCEYVGMTDPGLRKVFERDTCNITTLTRIAKFFSVPITYFLPEDSQVNKEEIEKDREIENLRGQVKAYETALSLLSRGKDLNEPFMNYG